MNTVIAAIDADSAAPATFRAGLILAGVYDAELEVVHVHHPGRPDFDLAAAIGADVEVPVRLLQGDPPDAITAAIEAPDVMAAAIGARDAGQGRPAGHVALQVARRVDRPVGLVPPEAQLDPEAPHHRVLVPLDGSPDSALIVRATVRRAAAAGIEVLVLHVFGPDTAPMFLDRPEHDLPVWAEEFLARSGLEPGCQICWRSGVPGTRITEVAMGDHVDAVVLGWSQVIDEGHAAVVRDVLTQARVPVLLVPKAAAERTLAEASAAPTHRSEAITGQ